ncbi:MAG TPA: hypothetical protein VGC79_01650, partial [Polyangiaceae bacterium]
KKRAGADKAVARRSNTTLNYAEFSGPSELAHRSLHAFVSARTRAGSRAERSQAKGARTRCTPELSCETE